jgi:hypothetical protein
MPRIGVRGTLEHWQHFLPFMVHGLIAISAIVDDAIDLVFERQEFFTFA